ncbi:MAG: hypothetical protein E3J69_01545 [Anaerolineales bacterium]|nr:MAG: hypothetical protein E3J69_01545 [Anaerolineales bacterium]
MGYSEHPSKSTEPTSIIEVLTAMIDEGKFQAAVVTSSDGLPIASAPAGYDSDVTSAMVALLQRVSSDARNQLGMSEVDEVMIYDRDRIRLICRYLTVGKVKIILAAIVPPGLAYRQITNQAIRQIKRLLS